MNPKINIEKNFKIIPKSSLSKIAIEKKSQSQLQHIIENNLLNFY